MVYYQPSPLDRIFAALADPTRRALLASLSETESVSVSELAKPFAMSLPAVMKHLDVLAGAGLVAREKNGRTVSCRLEAAPMQEATDWLNRYQRFWNQRLDQLAAFLEEDECPTPSASPRPNQALSNQASPSSDASAPRRRKSSPPGPTRKR